MDGEKDVWSDSTILSFNEGVGGAITRASGLWKRLYNRTAFNTHLIKNHMELYQNVERPWKALSDLSKKKREKDIESAKEIAKDLPF